MKKDLSQYKSFYDKHQNCTESKNNLTKSGFGSSVEKDDNICHCESNCNCEKQENPLQPDLVEILPVKSPTLEIPSSSKDKQTSEPIQDHVILSKVWKRFSLKAKSLLEALKSNENFVIDNLGIVFIDKKNIHASIFDLLPLSFYPIKKNVQGESEYVEFLRKNNLTSFITNKALLLNDNNYDIEYWYYIGDK